ncbi:hypothetical protein A9Q84_00410 [Halobacteriovorax marinus]|uniref:DUF427 domain-containing protein n=1 Tax=Halobacteriovorax marinus TaxID=97084 RepID=A0A1Y5FH42_9BACT|nr:hypothetical protein A9Q84_00410 [Halobacteriovorax marinus]
MDHYLIFEHPKEQIEVWLGNTLLAKSSSTLLLKEIGGLGYPPVYYFDPKDVRTAELKQNEKKLFCYLKGESTFWSIDEFDLAIWSYLQTYDEAKPLEGKIAFSPKVFEVVSE